jgi:diguanylate cyclase (GGDEF)-like protein
MDKVQEEFDTLYGYFENGTSPELRLVELMPEAMSELANSTTHSVSQMHVLMNEAAQNGSLVHGLAEEYVKLADKARLDPLTGVFNRGGFLETAGDALKNAARYQTPFGLVFFDLNGFKQANDTHGHAFGDFVLKDLCQRIQGKFARGAAFGRVGGDEFAIFLADSTAEQVRELVASFIRCVAEEPFVKGKTAVGIQISVGVLVVPPTRTIHKIESLLEQADQLMCRSKRSGKGQACFSELQAATVN